MQRSVQTKIEKKTKDYISSFYKKGEFEITKNYWGITLTAIPANV